MLIYFVMVASEAPLIQKDDMRSRVHEACGTSDIKRALDKLYLLLRFLAMTKIDTLSSFSGKRYLDAIIRKPKNQTHSTLFIFLDAFDDSEYTLRSHLASDK